MNDKTRSRLALVAAVTLPLVLCGSVVFAHPHSLAEFLRARQAAAEKDEANSLDAKANEQERPTCKLTIDLVDADSGKPLFGIVRIIDASTGKAVRLPDLIQRDNNWFAMSRRATVAVPQGKLTVEALRGLETEMASHELDLTGKETHSLKASLKRFFNASSKGWRSGNTHLHLMKLTHAEAIRYLETVPRADAVDLVYLSHLRRIPDERHYISNAIVEGSLAGGELQRLSKDGLLFAPGQEHRHNFGGYGEGYGHVMFLDIARLIRPVSIGPGIMAEGTDGIPLQRGIKTARGDGATVVWCHNKFGFEDVPNWMAGLLHAQNIFDGGEHGSYDATYYRYLNLGMKVPFSTGTDWFIYDFSRVYVPMEGELTSKKWLAQLAAGRTFITNGPLLQLSAGGQHIGDTIALAEPGSVPVKASGLGRADFKGIELVYNGEVIRSKTAKKVAGHHAAEIEFEVQIDEPGWLALRVPLDAGNNEFDRQIFAHTSPIYVEIAGRRIFRSDVARELIGEIKQNIETINEKGKFANDGERDKVLEVHRRGMEILRQRLKDAE